MSGDRIKGKLSKVEAEKRFASVTPKDIQYRMFFNFDIGKTYSGLNELIFVPRGEDIFLDYRGDTIDQIWINGEELPKERIESETLRKGGKFYFPPGIFKQGVQNKILMKFTNRYYSDGDGIHSYTDNENKQYLYTQTEPYEASRILPLFDQPDLKARYEIFAAAPADWKIITSELEEEHTTFGEFEEKEVSSEDSASEFLTNIKTSFGGQISKEKGYFRFKNTFPLSTYLNNIVAGPYRRFDCPKELLHREIPMSVYCRENLAEYVEAQLTHIFESHSKGIAFYEKFFSYNYPFSKCDAIFCPEYTVGAMEYPGSITYSESSYLYRKKVLSNSERSNRTRVILHELAHMWFGNLVTMKWWSDLWLNESFADFACFQAWGKILGTTSFELSHPSLYFIDRKSWAFLQDQEVTTHPVACHVQDTDEAQSIFDGITYPKGAMCMTQLMYLIGEERFSKALGKYFQTHAWSNTSLQDLLDVCIEVVGSDYDHEALDISKWKADWLVKPGLNEVEPSWDAGANEGQATVTITQTAAREDYPTLRYHKIGVAFYGEEGKLLKTKEIILNNQAVTEVKYDASLGVKAVLLNHGDMSYIKVRLDSTSLEYFKNNFSNLESMTDKAIICRAVFDQLRDAKMNSSEFFDWMLPIYKNVKSASFINFISKYLRGTVANYTPSDQFGEISHKLFELTLKKLEGVEDYDTIAALKLNLFAFAYDETDIDFLVQMKFCLFGCPDKEFSTREKWRIVYFMFASNRYTEEEKKETFDKLWDLDKTDTKIEFKLKIEAMTADDEKRKSLFADYVEASKMSYKHLEYSISGFNSKFVDKKRKAVYHDDYFRNILEISRQKSNMVAKKFIYGLFPSSADKKYLLDKLNEVIAQIDSENERPLLKKMLQKKDGVLRSAKVLGESLD